MILLHVEIRRGFMKGIIKDKREPGVSYRTDLPVPEPGENDVLVKVKAAAICGSDRHNVDWDEYAANRFPVPMVFGHEFSGEVVKIGSGVKDLKVGDRIAGETHIPCNDCYMCASNGRHNCAKMKLIGLHIPGSFAEYISIPEDCAYKFDDSLSYEHAAMLEPMGVAVHALTVADVKDQDVVIYGAGPIGLMAVGAAKALGAKMVISVDRHEARLAVANTMGADAIVNGNECDPVEAVFKLTGGKGADIVIEYAGSLSAIYLGFDMLRKSGKLIAVGVPPEKVNFDWTRTIVQKETTVIGVFGRLMYETWEECDRILKTTDFSMEPVVGGIYPLEDFMVAYDAIKTGKPGKMILIP